MKKTGSILLSVVTALSLLTNVLPGGISAAEDNESSTSVQSVTSAEDSMYLRVVSDPVQFDLAEDYDVAESVKQVSIQNLSTSSMSYEGCTVSEKGFAVQPIGSKSGSVTGGGTASFKVTPKDGMTYDTTAHNGDIVFKFKDTEGAEHIKTVGFSWRVNAEYSQSITVSPVTLDFGTLLEGYAAPEAKTVKLINADETLKVTAYRPSSKYLTTGELVCGSDKNTDKSAVVFNKPVSFTVAPAAGRGAGVYEDKLDIKFIDENGKASVKTVTVTYEVKAKEKEKQSHTVELVSASGSISGQGESTKFTAVEDTAVNISAAPEAGYVFSKWEVVSGSLTLEHPNSAVTSFFMGNEDVKIKAVFEKVPEGSYSVTVKGNVGGSAWTDTPIANKGDKVYVHAVPDDGYHFVKHIFIIDGKVIQEVDGPEVDFELPDKDIEVRTVFEADPYKVILSADGYGVVKAGKYTGEEGDKVYIAAAPDKGYKFKEWKVVSGGAVIEDKTAQSTSFTFGKADAKIKAVFVKKDYKVNITSKGNGTATAEPAYGEGRFLVTAYPDEGYKLKKFIVSLPDDSLEVTDNSFYITCGSAETVDVTVEFEKAPVVTTVSTTAVTTTTTTTVTTSRTSFTTESTSISKTTPVYVAGVFKYDVDCSLSDVTVSKGSKTAEMELTYDEFGYWNKEYRHDEYKSKVPDEMKLKPLKLPDGMKLVKAVDGSGKEFDLDDYGRFNVSGYKAVLTISLPDNIKAGKYEVEVYVYHYTTYSEKLGEGIEIGGTEYGGEAKGTITVTDGKVTTSVTANTSDTSGTTVSKTTTTTTTDKTEPTDSKYVLYGDVDLSGKVDLADVTYLAKHLLSPASNPLGDPKKGNADLAKRSSDVNGDDIIDTRDLSKLIEYNLGKLMVTDLDPRTHK